MRKLLMILVIVAPLLSCGGDRTVEYASCNTEKLQASYSDCMKNLPSSSVSYSTASDLMKNCLDRAREIWCVPKTP